MWPERRPTRLEGGLLIDVQRSRRAGVSKLTECTLFSRHDIPLYTPSFCTAFKVCEALPSYPLVGGDHASNIANLDYAGF